MTELNIAQQRLCNQGISQPRFEKAGDVVQWLGAVQSQDYGAAKWAVGLRSYGLTDDDVEQAFTKGEILRTHVMRPTWHFVAPTDIRWLLTLTAPRVHAINAYYYRKLELDETTCIKSHAILTKALQGGNYLTRTELSTALQQAGIAAQDLMRSTHIIMHAELDGIICSGPRRGKQFTYALLDERAPQVQDLTHDEVLAELTRRYFTSHGPATAQDFAWWSGLTLSDARIGLEMVATQLFHETIDERTYWFSSSITSSQETSEASCYLLPNYDEYLVGYTDRSMIFDTSQNHKLDSRNNILFNHTVIVDGQIIGTWKRTLKSGHALLTLDLFTSINKAENALLAAANQYGRFADLPVNTTFT